MWFNNIQIFQYELDDDLDLEHQLTQDALKPCPPHARYIYGWVPVIHDQMTHSITGATLICMGKEERILPRGVIVRELNERVLRLEQARGRPIKRSEKKQMAEELEFELLPKAFCVQKRMFALFDHINKRLFVNSSSPTQAAQLTSLLRKSLPSLRMEPFALDDNFAQQLASWIANPSLVPAPFQLASDCLLFSLDDKNKRFNCKGYELPSEEILTLLNQNLACKEVSMIWNDRIQLTLTQDFIFKRLKCLDYLKDEQDQTKHLDESEAKDALLILFVGELQGLLFDLMNNTQQESKQTSMPEEVVV